MSWSSEGGGEVMGKRNRLRIERIRKGEEQPQSCGKSQSRIWREIRSDILSTSPLVIIATGLARRGTKIMPEEGKK